MPTLDENLEHWDRYDWSCRGEEWSKVWGGTHNLWYGSLRPRIADYLGAQTVLEIAPGFGRITQYLRSTCSRMIVVDITDRCIEACRARFGDDESMEFYVNDGRSFPMVADRSVDLAFSFDSLVHCEFDVISGYLGELARTLTRDGVAFLHHSNLGIYLDPEAGGLTIENFHWRGASVTAELVRHFCESIGLRCIHQEIVNWGHLRGSEFLSDCFSTITRIGSRFEKALTIVENPGFMDEALRIGREGVP